MCEVMEKLSDESLVEGRAEGRVEGRETQAKDTALRMLQRGFSIEEIADIINVSVETVKQWLAAKQSA